MKRRNAVVMVCALVASVALLGWWLMTRDPFAITPERREALMAGAAAETEKINNLIRAQIKPATDRWAELEPKLVAFTAEYDRLTGYDPLASEYVSPVGQLLVGDLSRPGLEKGREVLRSNTTEELVRLLGRADERFEVAWVYAVDQPPSDQVLGPKEIAVAGMFRRLPDVLAARMRLAVADGEPSEVRSLVRAAMANTRAAGGRLITFSIVMATLSAATALGEARLLAMEGAVPVAELHGWIAEIDEGRPQWDLVTLAEAWEAVVRAESKWVGPDLANREAGEQENELVRSTRELEDSPLGQAWRGLNAEVDATRLVLAIEIHKAVHGEYPTDLGELDLEPLGGRLPQDSLAGGPFEYKRLVDGERPYELSGTSPSASLGFVARRVYSEPRDP